MCGNRDGHAPETSATLRLRYSSGVGRFNCSSGPAGTSWITEDMVRDGRVRLVGCGRSVKAKAKGKEGN